MSSIGLFIDSENVSYVDIPFIMDELSKIGRIIVNRIYADWTSSYTENWKQYLITYASEPIHCPKIPRKNSVDIKIIDDIYDILFFRQTVDIYVLVSNDIDFLSVGRRIKLMGKLFYVCGGNNCGEILYNVADKFINISQMEYDERSEIEFDNIFDMKDDGDDVLDKILEIMNGEKHLNMTTLKHRIKDKLDMGLINEKIENFINKRYKNQFRIITPLNKKKKIYDISAINTDIHNTIYEQFDAVFQMVHNREMLLSRFNEKLRLLIKDFDYRLWGFESFRDMIDTIFRDKLEIVSKENTQYIVNLDFVNLAFHSS